MKRIENGLDNSVFSFVDITDCEKQIIDLWLVSGLSMTTFSKLVIKTIKKYKGQ